MCSAENSSKNPNRSNPHWGSIQNPSQKKLTNTSSSISPNNPFSINHITLPQSYIQSPTAGYSPNSHLSATPNNFLSINYTSFQRQNTENQEITQLTNINSSTILEMSYISHYANSYYQTALEEIYKHLQKKYSLATLTLALQDNEVIQKGNLYYNSIARAVSLEIRINRPLTTLATLINYYPNIANDADSHYKSILNAAKNLSQNNNSLIKPNNFNTTNHMPSTQENTLNFGATQLINVNSLSTQKNSNNINPHHTPLYFSNITNRNDYSSNTTNSDLDTTCPNDNTDMDTTEDNFEVRPTTDRNLNSKLPEINFSPPIQNPQEKLILNHTPQKIDTLNTITSNPNRTYTHDNNPPEDTYQDNTEELSKNSNNQNLNSELEKENISNNNSSNEIQVFNNNSIVNITNNNNTKKYFFSDDSDNESSTTNDNTNVTHDTHLYPTSTINTEEEYTPDNTLQQNDTLNKDPNTLDVYDDTTAEDFNNDNTEKSSNDLNNEISDSELSEENISNDNSLAKIQVQDDKPAEHTDKNNPQEYPHNTNNENILSNNNNNMDTSEAHDDTIAEDFNNDPTQEPSYSHHNNTENLGEKNFSSPEQHPENESTGNNTPPQMDTLNTTNKGPNTLDINDSAEDTYQYNTEKSSNDLNNEISDSELPETNISNDNSSPNIQVQNDNPAENSDKNNPEEYPHNTNNILSNNNNNMYTTEDYEDDIREDIEPANIEVHLSGHKKTLTQYDKVVQSAPQYNPPKDHYPNREPTRSYIGFNLNDNTSEKHMLNSTVQSFQETLKRKSSFNNTQKSKKKKSYTSNENQTQTTSLSYLTSQSSVTEQNENSNTKPIQFNFFPSTQSIHLAITPNSSGLSISQTSSPTISDVKKLVHKANLYYENLKKPGELSETKKNFEKSYKRYNNLAKMGFFINQDTDEKKEAFMNYAKLQTVLSIDENKLFDLCSSMRKNQF